MPRKARLGFIGAGWWATANYMPLLAARDDVELAAVCRLGADGAAQGQGPLRLPLRHRDRRGTRPPARPRWRRRHLAAHAALRTRPRWPWSRGCTSCATSRCVRAATTPASWLRLAKREGPPSARALRLALQAVRAAGQALARRRAHRRGAVRSVPHGLAHPRPAAGQALRGRGQQRPGRRRAVRAGPDAPGPTRKSPAAATATPSCRTPPGMLCLLTGLVPESVYALMAAPAPRWICTTPSACASSGGAIGTVSGAGTVPPVGMASYQVDLRLFGIGGDAAAGLRAGAAGTAPPRRHTRQRRTGPRRRGVFLRGAAGQLRRADPRQDDGQPLAGRGGHALGAAARRGLSLGGLGTGRARSVIGGW